LGEREREEWVAAGDEGGMWRRGETEGIDVMM
jgi:hypothetical protein